MRKYINTFVSVLLMLSLLSVTACKNGDDSGSASQNTKVTWHKEDYSLPEKKQFDSSYNAFPRPEHTTKKTVYYADITNCPYPELFLSVTLQGIVNADAPELYLIHDYVVQAASATFNSPQFWFDALDKSYFEEDGVTPYFEKIDAGNAFDLVERYYDKIKGVVLYHDRLMVRNVMASQDSGPNIYGDMAVLNLTSMMCSQLNALPVTEGLLGEVNEKLEEQGKEPLKVLGDTREFMLKDEEGVYAADRSSLDVWYKCYRYALDKAKAGEWTFSDMCIAHNGTFNAANYDYSTAYKMFNYQRIFDGAQSETVTADMIKNLEVEILSLTRENSPVIGVFHLTGDEEGMVRFINNYGKYFAVTHETWNLSWTCGLERVEAEEKPKDISYDPEKIYVAMTYSESDNNSYVHFKLPLVYENPLRGTETMTWAISASCVDLNPNVIKYMNATMAPGDGYAMGESGVGYIRNENVTEEYKAGFFGINDVYSQYLNGSIRTLLNRLPQSMDYVTYMDNLTSVLAGYSGISVEGTAEYNSDKANYYFQDTPIFQNLCALDANGVKDILDNVHVMGGTFYSIGLYGWAGDFTSLANVMANASDRIEFVSQYQLAQLYKEKMSAVYNDITEADFVANSGVNEVAYLWHSDDYENVQKAVIGGMDEFRYGRRNNYVIYRFDLAENMNKARFTFDIEGEYLIEASADLVNWATLADVEYDKQTTGKRHQIQCDIPPELTKKAVYIKITDNTPEDGTGYSLYRCNLQTDVSEGKTFDFDTRYDKQYLVSSSAHTDEGYRTGEVIYKLPLDTNISALDLAIEADEVTGFGFSADGKNFFNRKLNVYDRSSYEGYGNYYTYTVTDIVPNLYLKITGRNIKRIGAHSVNTFKQIDFSPVGCDFDVNDITLGRKAERSTDGLGSYALVYNTDVLQYSFMLDKSVKDPVLKLSAGGMFRLEISTDGGTWTTLKAVQPGENITGELVFDISAYAKAGSICYLRFGKSVETGGPATLYYVKTN